MNDLHLKILTKKLIEKKESMSDFSRSTFWVLLALSLAILGIDFYIINLPLSGWILQAIIVGVFLEYLKPKKTLLLVALIEIFFISSYGGWMTVLALLSLIGQAFFLPLIVLFYFVAVLAIFSFGIITNHLFHKINLFERLTRSGHLHLN